MSGSAAVGSDMLSAAKESIRNTELTTILLVVLICYVFWVVVSAAIQRRLQQEMPDPDKEEEMEEGSF